MGRLHISFGAPLRLNISSSNAREHGKLLGVPIASTRAVCVLTKIGLQLCQAAGPT